MHTTNAHARIITALVSIAAAAALSACGGGGTHATALPAAASTPGTVSQPASTARLTVTFTRHAAHTKSASAHARASAALKRIASAKRAPKYISPSAAGLQISVSAPGGVTSTIYADISTSSPLCITGQGSNGNPGVTTCTIPLTGVAVGDGIVATEVDTPPVNENSGIGTGLSNTADILADGATTIAAGATPGTVTIVPLALGPVAAADTLYDCAATQASATINAGDVGRQGNDSLNRIVVTAGVASTIQVQPQLATASGNNNDYFLGTPGQPFENTLATPTPVTFVSSTTEVTLASVTDPAVSTTAASAFGTIATFADSGAQSNVDTLQDATDGCFTMLLDVKYDGIATTPSTITASTNDTATNPSFPNGSYNDSFVMWNVVPISATPANVPLNLGATAIVTGSDSGAGSNMTATPCNDTNGNTLASVTSNGDIDPTSGLQMFTVTANVVGTCTFVLVDGDTADQEFNNATEPGVQTLPVTVTIGNGGTSPVTITGRHRTH